MSNCYLCPPTPQPGRVCMWWDVVVFPLILLRLFGFENAQQTVVQNCYLVAKSQQVYCKIVYLFHCFQAATRCESLLLQRSKVLHCLKQGIITRVGPSLERRQHRVVFSIFSQYCSKGSIELERAYLGVICSCYSSKFDLPQDI